MANDYSGSTWVIDTAAASELTAAVFGKRTVIYLKQIRWVGGTTAGHVASVTDGDSDQVWYSVAAGANNVESDMVERWVDGLIVPTLGSGKLYISIGT